MVHMVFFFFFGLVLWLWVSLDFWIFGKGKGEKGDVGFFGSREVCGCFWRLLGRFRS